MDTALEARLVHVSGSSATADTLEDADFGVRVECVGGSGSEERQRPSEESLRTRWLFFVFVYGCPVPVGGHAEGNGLSVFILLAMVAAVIVSIAASGWKMSKGLGYTMFGLYFVFIAQELARNYS